MVNNFEILPTDPEQRSEAGENNPWDNLAKLSQTETWEEHIQKANELASDYTGGRGRDPKFQDERDFVQKMDEYRRGKLEGDTHTIGKTEKFRNQRSQEFFEREINSRLTDIEELEIYSGVEGSGVEKTSIKYDNQEIPIYNLSNYPIRFMQTVLDYKKDLSEDDKRLNQKTISKMEEVLNDPSIWNTHEADINLTDDDLQNGRQGKSNRISVSYINCGDAESLRRRFNGDCCYGFSHLEGNSVIDADMTDIVSRSDIGKDDSKLTEDKVQRLLTDLEHPGESHYKGFNGAYNEIVIRRYNENGDPKRPDFMVVQDGNINPIALKHAKYFNIPVVNINTKTYLYSDETISKEYTTEQISNNYADLLATGANPDFIKSKLSAEAAWNNYDTLKTYIPDLNVNTEFNNLVAARYSQEVAKYGNTFSAEDQRRVYADVVYDAMMSDVYDFLDRGGDRMQLAEMANKTGDTEVINYVQQLLNLMK